MKRIYINAGPYGMFLFRYMLLEYKKKQSEQLNIYMEKNERDQDEYVIVEEPRKSGIDILSGILVQYIFDIYEPEIIGSLIGNLSGFYDYSDRYNILDKTKVKLVGHRERILDSQKAAFINIVELLQSGSVFNIEGFIVFRLKEYIFLLRKLVEEAMDDFLSEKEHAEFMLMLAYFVDMQEARVDAVHIVHFDESSYGLFDESGNRYHFHNGQSLAEQITVQEEAEDILIGMLISLLPGKIVIHDSQKQMSGQLANILSEIFKERVQICRNCPDCTLLQNVSMEVNPTH